MDIKTPKLPLRIKFSGVLYAGLVLFLLSWLVKSYIDFKKTTVSPKEDVVAQNITIITKIDEKSVVVEKHRRILDGVFVDKEEETRDYPIAIVIENLLESRPQAGLDKAGLVYEVAAEGGITRFLAVFSSLEGIERIGPIRSARPYFLDWSEEFSQPIFLHVGGSPESLGTIKSRKILNLDEFYWQKDYYLRVKDKKRPHNVYTKPELLENIKQDYLLSTGKYDVWQFKDDAKSNERGDISVNEIDFFRADYDYDDDYFVSWKYDQKMNEYTRWQGDYLHQAENDEAIKAKNIVVMYTDEKIIDEVGRLKIRTIGDGDALIFQDGNVIEGKWRKDDNISRTKFYDNEDNEIAFNAGQTWIEVVPVGNDVLWK